MFQQDEAWLSTKIYARNLHIQGIVLQNITMYYLLYSHWAVGNLKVK